MKKLLAGTLCVLGLAMPVCAVNGDNATNDQNDALDNAAAVANDEVRNVQSELYGVLRRALLFGEWFDRPENCINIISNLIRNGAEFDDRILSDRDNAILSAIVFNNPNFNQFPDDVRNHILGKALLFYVKNRFCYAGPYNYNQELKYNYKAIKALWKLNPPIDFTDDQGHTALQIAENRYNTWQNGETPDDIGMFFTDGQSGFTDLQGRRYRDIFDFSFPMIVLVDNDINIGKVRNQERRKVQQHDKKVWMLLTRNARHGQNSCTIC
ncbi:MAG: hypothetical protein IJG00_00760 [Clostridia bacterium]|nr:hypothetical protein [Clostridia bacterium]